MGDGGQLLVTVADITDRYGINSATLLKVVLNNSAAYLAECL